LTPRREVEAGTLLADRFRVERTLGQGGMGTVFEVTHVHTKHRRALKLLHSELSANHEASDRFLREASVAGRIGHPNIVEVYDAGRLETGEPYLLMELLRGESLEQLLERHPQGLPLELSLRLVETAALALHAAHQQEIIHRDIKPANLFLKQPNQDLTVLDFGISKFSGEHTRMASPTGTTMLGTPSYMAPEQFDGGGQIDARTDVHALGLVLYECLSGQQAYQADQLMVLLRKISFGERRPLAELRPELPTSVLRLADKALATDKNQRFESALKLAEALRYEAEAATRTSALPAKMSNFASGRPQALERPSAPLIAPDHQHRAEGHSMIPGSTTMGLAAASSDPAVRPRTLTVIGLGAGALVLGLVVAIPLAQRTGVSTASATSVAESAQVKADQPASASTASPTVRVASSSSAPPASSSVTTLSAPPASASAPTTNRKPPSTARTSHLATSAEYP
jgi:serine/threonine protein kinase